MADKELNYILRIIAPDNKVPALDTRDAEAAIAKLRALIKQMQAEWAASFTGGGAPNAPHRPGTSPSVGPTPSAPQGYPAPVPSVAPPMAPPQVFQPPVPPMAPPAPMGPRPATPGSSGWPYTLTWDGRGPGGGRTVIDYPPGSPYAPPPGPAPPDPRAGATWATRPQYGPWNVSWGMGYGAQGTGGYSHGPISDPGTATVPGSLSTARGYDQAMLREQLQGLNFSGVEQGTERVARGMTKAREAAIGLTAALVLLNKSQEQGSGWDNWYTQGTAGLGIASYGTRLAGGAADLVRGGANIGAGALAGASALAGAGKVGRAAAWGSRGLAGLAGASTLSIAAPLSVAAGFGIAYASAAYDNYQAGVRGQELDLANQSINDQRRLFGMMNSSTAAANAALGIGNSATMDFRRAMSGEFSSFTLESVNARRLRAIGANAGIARGNFEDFTGPGDEQARVHAGEQLINILRQEQQILNQNVQKRQQEYQIQVQQVRVSQQQVDAARQLASQAGRVSNSDWRRGMAIARRAQRNGLNERDAEALDDLPGFGGAVDRFFSDRGQQRIDAIPKEFRDEKAKGSAEIAALEAKIKQFEGTQSAAVKALQDFVALNAGAWETIESEINAIKGEMANIINRNPTPFRGR